MEPFVFVQGATVPRFSLAQWEKEFPHLSVGFSAIEEGTDWNHFNYALHVGNQVERVILNRRYLSEDINMPFSAWTSGDQVHEANVVVVSRHHRGRGRELQGDALPRTDGLITEEADVLLASYYADCVPLYFYSSDRDIVAVAHAGWRGTVAGIAREVISRLVILGAKTENILVAIGPSIGACCYEVDWKVTQAVKQILSSSQDYQDVLHLTDQKKCKLDLKETNRLLIQKEGVLPSRISVSSWCTSCHAHYFHSHRRRKGDTGRMVAWIGKRKESDGSDRVSDAGSAGAD